MTRNAAIIHIIIVLSLIIFATYNFYTANFILALSTLPILILYYYFLVGREKRAPVEDDKGDRDREEGV